MNWFNLNTFAGIFCGSCAIAQFIIGNFGFGIISLILSVANFLLGVNR